MFEIIHNKKSFKYFMLKHFKLYLALNYSEHHITVSIVTARVAFPKHLHGSTLVLFTFSLFLLLVHKEK